jgi:hypothetical protein
MIFEHRKTAVGHAFDGRLSTSFSQVSFETRVTAVASDLGDTERFRCVTRGVLLAL